MEQNWTKEPWTPNLNWGIEGRRNDVGYVAGVAAFGGFSSNRADTGPESTANRDRSIACVNAMSGIPDPAALAASHARLKDALELQRAFDKWDEKKLNELLSKLGYSDRVIPVQEVVMRHVQQALSTAKEIQ